MSKLDGAQKKWLVDLGVLVGSRLDDVAAGPKVSASKSGAKAPDAAAIQLWKTRRAAAVASLKAVAGKIAAAKHASSAHAIIEIQAVLSNLSAEPATLQQVTELQHYLGSDDVVNDVCELAEDIRTPLLDALGRLHTALAG
jgi:hypothetical protein